MWAGMDHRASLVVLYPASDNDALDAQAPLLDDRRIKSSYDCLYTCQPKQGKKHSAEEGYLPRQKRS